jgi:hypothetical protein
VQGCSNGGVPEAASALLTCGWRRSRIASSVVRDTRQEIFGNGSRDVLGGSSSSVRVEAR